MIAFFVLGFTQTSTAETPVDSDWTESFFPEDSDVRDEIFNFHFNTLAEDSFKDQFHTPLTAMMGETGTPLAITSSTQPHNDAGEFKSTLTEFDLVSFRGQSPSASEHYIIEPAYGSGGPYNTPIETAWSWTFLPQGFMYRTYFASAAEPRLSTQIFRDLQRGSLLDTSAGGRFGIVRFGERYAERGFQLDLVGNAKLRQNADSGLDMTGTDFRFDIPLTYRNGPHAFKVGYYHISAHAGDEFLVAHPGFQRLNYLRDAINFGYSYNVTPETRLYGEIDWAFNTDVTKPWHFQFGLDYGPALPTGATGAPFFAFNVHLREEVDFGGNLQVQAGWAWRGEGVAAGTLRTGPFYYNGKSPQFSFYNQSEQQVGWGLWYDF